MRKASSVDLRGSVDSQLLADLAWLEARLVNGWLKRDSTQALIGQAIFTQYLVDRRIVTTDRLEQIYDVTSLPAALRMPEAAAQLFGWLRDVFNGDMFPGVLATEKLPRDSLCQIADFLEATNIETWQGSLFPYQFDVIPVELVSSIYEQFVHADNQVVGSKAVTGDASSNATSEASALGIHYTRLPVVQLVLYEVMNGLTGKETVLDLTC